MIIIDRARALAEWNEFVNGQKTEKPVWKRGLSNTINKRLYQVDYFTQNRSFDATAAAAGRTVDATAVTAGRTFDATAAATG